MTKEHFYIMNILEDFVPSKLLLESITVIIQGKSLLLMITKYAVLITQCQMQVSALQKLLKCT